MQEILINLHIHSNYSDGSGSFSDIVNAAINCGLDAIITTDHNVLVNSVEGYHESDSKKLLLLTGEEVHDQSSDPQKNHLLVFGAGTEVAPFASNQQGLIDKVKSLGGLAFIAHPVDLELPLFREGNISWERWDVSGYDGIELWNGLSELKSVIKTRFDAIKYGLFPQLLAHNPLQETIRIWDELLLKGKRIVAVGGSDSHAMTMRMGVIKKTIYPYKFHFSAINTHVFLPELLTGNLEHDRKMIYNSLRRGNAFIGYDLPAKTKGFRFECIHQEKQYIMGDEVLVSTEPIEFNISTPFNADINLLKDGKIVISTFGTNLKYLTPDPGVYRTEVFKKYYGKMRGWIFSNPIYVRNKL